MLAFLLPFGAAFAVAPLLGVMGSHGPGWLAPVGVLFALPFVLAGAFAWLIAFAARWGYSEVRVEAGELLAIECVGPLRWTRRRSAAGAAALRIHDAGVVVNARRIGGFGNLLVDYSSGRPFGLAFGFRVEVLQHVSTELAPHLGIDLGDQPIEVEHPPEVAMAPAADGIPPQPDTSRAELEHNAAGLMLRLPPAGIMRGSRGLFWFALFWLGFVAVMTVLALLSSRGSSAWALTPFWLIGATLLAVAANLGLRRAIIGVVQGELIIRRTNMLGTKVLRWVERSDRIGARWR